MNEVLLVAVVALAIALMSIVINLMLVARISVLKSDLELLDKIKLGDLKGQNSTTYSGLLSLKNKTKDALEIVTNNLNLHGILLEESSAKFDLLDGRVAKHTEQLDDLGKFAGVTTGELRNLEHKIYNTSKSKEFEDTKERDGELFGIRQRLSILEKKQEDNLKRDSEMEESINLCHEHTNANNNQLNRLGERLSVVEIKLAKAFEEFNHDLKTIQSSVVLMQKDVLTRYNELNWKLKGVCTEELDYDVRKKKPDRRRKDNYYRRPNQVSVGDIKDFEGDVFK